MKFELKTIILEQPIKNSVVLIPTYNELENIGKLIKLIINILPEINIIVIDDNSPDGTSGLVTSLKKKYTNLSLISRKENRGYGLSLKEGLKFAIKRNYQFVVTMDADLSHNPKAIPELIQKAHDYSVIIGSRYIESGNIEAEWSVFRRMVSRLGSRFAKAMLGLPINDCTSGFRCYQSQIIKKIDLESIKSNGYSFLIELLNKCSEVNSTFSEIPITYVDRQYGKSKLSRRIIVEAFFLVIKLGLLRVLKKPRIVKL